MDRPAKLYWKSGWVDCAGAHRIHPGPHWPLLLGFRDYLGRHATRLGCLAVRGRAYPPGRLASAACYFDAFLFLIFPADLVRLTLNSVLSLSPSAFLPSRDSIRTSRTIPLLKFLARAHGSNIGDAIHRQYPVQVVDLMLQQLR